MYDAVFNGSHAIAQDKLPLLQAVLDEGLLVPQRTTSGDASQRLTLDTITLVMPCPLMASCILQRLCINRFDRWHHGIGDLNRVGDLLVQVS